jgi:hypothetical protein
MIYNKTKLLELGGVRDSNVKKWDKKSGGRGSPERSLIHRHGKENELPSVLSNNECRQRSGNLR